MCNLIKYFFCSPYSIILSVYRLIKVMYTLILLQNNCLQWRGGGSTNTNWFIYFGFVVKFLVSGSGSSFVSLYTFWNKATIENIICSWYSRAILLLSFKCFYLPQNVLKWMWSLKLISILFFSSHLFRRSQVHSHCYGLILIVRIFMCVF